MQKIAVFFLAFTLIAVAQADGPASARYSAPKAPFAAGAAAIRLFDSHDYFATSPAPDFWALMPYYIPQEEGTCAASTLATVLNALNAHHAATADEKLITVKDLIAKVNDPAWLKSMKEKKCYGLDHLAEIVKTSLKLYGHDKAKVTVVHVNEDSASARATVHQALVENEATDRNFLIANFLQGQFTGDPEGTGHVSPVGAYDAARKRVLILDVDREYYEPYWVTEDVFFHGLNSRDGEADKFRGYIVINDQE